MDTDDTNHNMIEHVKGTHMKENKKYEVEIVWKNVFLMSILHLSGIYGGYLCVFGQVMWKTILLGIYLTFCFLKYSWVSILFATILWTNGFCQPVL